MSTLSVVIIVVVVVALVALWFFVAVRRLRKMTIALDEAWEDIFFELRRRQDMLPNLIETMRKFGANEALIVQMIKERDLAAREEIGGAKKIEYEHDLSKCINGLIVAGKENVEAKKDTNFLELKKNLGDLTQSIQQKTKAYNNMVRDFNKDKNKLYLKIFSKILGQKDALIFEFE
ncbi:LemA family protein [Patescibacteria group bacterium]|nr:LemA family protein [Patescibacteria group bacterium]